MTAPLIERLRAMPSPPDRASPAQLALWLDLRDDWAGAHRAVEAPDNADECLVHAYLHRVEGDIANAAYWYRRAGMPVCRTTLRQEQAALVDRLFT